MESRSIVDLERATCTLDCHIEAATLAEGATFDNDSEQFPVFLLREKNPTRRTLRAFLIHWKPNVGVDRAARIHATFAPPALMRKPLPPLRSN
jgi:hypothetical protein